MASVKMVYITTYACVMLDGRDPRVTQILMNVSETIPAARTALAITPWAPTPAIACLGGLDHYAVLISMSAFLTHVAVMELVTTL